MKKLLVIAAIGSMELLSLAKPYTVNVQPGLYADDTGLEEFQGTNTYYKGELTDGSVST
jgi:hypothetical protein